MQAIKNYSDSEIVAALKDNMLMDDAIKFIYSSYYGMLENYVTNNKGSEQDAGDVIQETLLTFIEVVQQNKYRGEASIKSFLYSITRNIWLSELRKRTNADNRHLVYEKGKDGEEQAAVEQLIYREHYKAIQDFFLRLGEKCKQLLMLVYYDELSMKEILDKTPDYQNEQVLRNKKYKCMKQLEEMIAENDGLKIQLQNALRHAR